MNAKNFLLSGIAGGITDFLLGWLLYGMLFRDYFAGPEPNMVYIFLGCMTFGMIVSYTIVRWADLKTFAAGLKAGAAIGFLYGLADNFFTSSGTTTVNYEKFAVDVVIMLIMGAGVGAVVALVNGALSKTAA
ncbi:MAG TPA: hypothetical protein VK528_00200 [Flavobacterium sp.]|nr:hypothetical protein [Flavobacterium sp.]